MPSAGVAIGAGTSLFSARAGAKSARRSNKLDKRALALAEGAYEEDRDYLLARRGREEAMLDPIQEALTERAMEGPDYEGVIARSDADVAQAYGMQRDQLRRQRERYGINPAAGRWQAEEHRLSNAQALAQVYGRNRARLQEDDRDWARKLAAYGTGNMRNAPIHQAAIQPVLGMLGRQSATQAANASGAFQLSGSLLADTMKGEFDDFGSGSGTRPTSSASTLNTWRKR